MPVEKKPLSAITSPGELAKEMLARSDINFDEDDAVEREFMISGLAAKVDSKVQEAVSARGEMESQWFKNIQAFRAEDISGNELRSETELSKIYLRA